MIKSQSTVYRVLQQKKSTVLLRRESRARFPRPATPRPRSVKRFIHCNPRVDSRGINTTKPRAIVYTGPVCTFRIIMATLSRARPDYYMAISSYYSLNKGERSNERSNERVHGPFSCFDYHPLTKRLMGMQVLCGWQYKRSSIFIMRQVNAGARAKRANSGNLLVLEGDVSMRVNNACENAFIAPIAHH